VVKIGQRARAELDPIPPRRVTMHGRVVRILALDLGPALTGDAEVDDSRCLKVGDFPAVDVQSGLVGITGTPFVS